MATKAEKKLAKQLAEEQMLIQIRKDTLAREEALDQITLNKIKDKWVETLIDTKVPEMQDNLRHILHYMEKLIEAENFRKLLLEDERQELEEKSTWLAKSHGSALETLFEIYQRRIQYLNDAYHELVSEKKAETEAEFKMIDNKEKITQDNMNMIIFQMRENKKKEEEVMNWDMRLKIDDEHSKNKEIMESLQTKLEKKMESRWGEITATLAKYEETTQARTKEYMKLKTRDDLDSKIIYQQTKQMQKLFEQLDELRRYNEECYSVDENMSSINDLREERMKFFNTFKQLKLRVAQELKEDEINLRTLTAASNNITHPWVDWFTCNVMKTPIKNFPNHKRSFLPSKSEKDKIAKLVHALKMGWIKTEEEKEKELKKKREPKFYMLWNSHDAAEEMRRIHDHIPAPKRLLPGHAESYNPPPEYLFDKKELKQWNKQTKLQQKRKLHFVPQKYSSLREVPAYDKFIYERFQRCLDLYLCPRGRKMRLTIEPEDLVPQLPNPKDLQPFPTVMSLVYKGHTDMVRTLTVDAKGQYLVSGSDDFTIKVWEISTGRCVKTIQCGGIVRSISWCPSQAISLILVAADRKVLLINPGVGDILVNSKTDILLEEPPESDAIIPERVRTAVQWEAVSPTSEEWLKGIRIIINHFKEVTQVSWHGRGDYFSTVMPDGANRSVIIHQLSKRRSQIPFSKSKGLVQCVLFHPIKPFLFVATQRHIRIYNLMKQELVKKLLSNSKWISTMAIHPGGDNVLVGTYDRKMLWFDLDLSAEPYQTLRLHSFAVRGVAFHKRYPLFASVSDDKNLIVCHGMVYNDLLQNPLIVPLKRLSHHESNNDFGIFSVLFHPTQPWVFTSGADGTVRLYT